MDLHDCEDLELRDSPSVRTSVVLYTRIYNVPPEAFSLIPQKGDSDTVPDIVGARGTISSVGGAGDKVITASANCFYAPLVGSTLRIERSSTTYTIASVDSATQVTVDTDASADSGEKFTVDSYGILLPRVMDLQEMGKQKGTGKLRIAITWYVVRLYAYG